MKVSYGVIFSVAYVIAGWLIRATKDHNITGEEWLELFELIGREMGLPVDLGSFPTKEQLKEKQALPSPPHA